MKKQGHAPALLFSMEPSERNRCQSGWSLSLTPHCLREVQEGKTALDTFAEDAVEAYRDVEGRHSGLAGVLPENSMLACVLTGGNEEVALFTHLRQPGIGRNLVTLLLRRLTSAVLDRGVVCNDRHKNPLREVMRRA